jgi:uncharacterized damage-inducible protein DinB
MEMFSKLVAHLEWADRRALDALEKAATTVAPALEIYAHIVGAEHVWISRLRGETPRLQPWSKLSLAECRDLAEANAGGLRAVIASLSNDDLQRDIEYRNSAGTAFHSTIEDVLLQVLLHGSYHRGQVAQLLRQNGAEPVATDFIAFTRGAPAPARS